MRELDDGSLELRLRGALREHLGPLTLDITVEDLERRRRVRDAARRRRRGLVALGLAAALVVPIGLLVGGGASRLEAVVVVDPSASPDASTAPEASAPLQGATPVVLHEWREGDFPGHFDAQGPGRFRIEALVAGKVVDLTLPAGWRFEDRSEPWTFSRPDTPDFDYLMVQGATPRQADAACGLDWVSPTSGQSMAEIVRDFTQLAGFTISPVADRTIDGHPVTTLIWSGTNSDCFGGLHRVYVIEVDGQPLVIHSRLNHAEAQPEVDAIIGSISIGD